MRTNNKLQHDREKGQGLVEYALIIVLVAVVVIVVLGLLGPTIGNVFSNVLGGLQGTTAGGGGGGGGGGGPTNSSFSGVITNTDSNDGGGRYFDVCTFTVSTTGTYSFSSVTTDKPSNLFWVTAGPTSMSWPASGFILHIQKPSASITSATLTAGVNYEAYPHSTNPAEFPVSYQFILTGPGSASGGC